MVVNILSVVFDYCGYYEEGIEMSPRPSEINAWSPLVDESLTRVEYMMTTTVLKRPPLRGAAKAAALIGITNAHDDIAETTAIYLHTRGRIILNSMLLSIRYLRVSARSSASRLSFQP